MAARKKREKEKNKGKIRNDAPSNHLIPQNQFLYKIQRIRMLKPHLCLIILK